MPLLTGTTAAIGGPAERTYAAVQSALRLIAADPVALSLARTATAEVDVDGPLGQWLYRAWWSGFGGVDETAAGADRYAVSALDAARRSVAAVDPGWLVLAVTEPTVVAANLHSGERARVRADAVCGSSRPGRPVRPGDLVTLLTGDAGLDPTGSWWWATTSRTASLVGAVDRWYVHTPDLDAALAAVPLLLELLSRLGVRASLKCPSTAALYGRRDALVVYLPRADAERAESALRAPAVAEACARLFHPDIPPLTRPLLPGVGAAQDPGGEVSYGQLRCAQLAAVAARVVGRFRDSALGTDVLEPLLAGVGIDSHRPEVLT